MTHFATLVERARQRQLPPVQLWLGDSGVWEEKIAIFTSELIGSFSGVHPNVFELSPLPEKKEITLEPTRGFLHFLKTTPTFPTWRVAIIRGADLLNRQSSNAILKVLEDPPKEVVILLLCASAGALLPTLLSRCTKIYLGGTHQVLLVMDVMQQLGKLILTIMTKGVPAVQDFLDVLEDAQYPNLVNGLRPFLYKLLAYVKGDQPPSQGFEHLLKLAPHAQWVESYMACSDYLDQAIPAHLPMREIVRGALYLIHNPRLAYDIQLGRL